MLIDLFSSTFFLQIVKIYMQNHMGLSVIYYRMVDIIYYEIVLQYVICYLRMITIIWTFIKCVIITVLTY